MSGISCDMFYGRKRADAILPDPELSDCSSTDSDEFADDDDFADEDYTPPTKLSWEALHTLGEPDIEENDSTDEEAIPVVAPTPAAMKSRKAKKTYTYRWRKRGASLVVPPKVVIFAAPIQLKSPCDYFEQMLDESVLDLIVYQTNLYSVQKNGQSVNTDTNEIRAFLGILLTMGVVHLPYYRDYWSWECRIPSVAEVMPLKRFEKLRRHLHFSDNLAVNTADRFAKIRPFLQKIRDNLMKIEQEGNFSIDETVVPYKGTSAGNLRQYIKNKPHKWGFKLFTLAGVSGIVYDFLPYGGSSTFHDVPVSEKEEQLGVTGSVVTALCNSIQEPSGSRVFMDNWFSSFELFQHLREEKNIYCLGTMNKARLRNCTLKPDKALMKEGRGSFDFCTEEASGLTVVKWADRKPVLLASNCIGTEPVSNVSRYCKSAKTKVCVPAPAIIKEYNLHMGGVDMSDMLVALYRTPFKSRRYYMRIFAYILDMCTCNAWLLYKRDWKSLGEPGSVLPLKNFRMQVAHALRGKGITPKKGRPNTSEPPKKIRKTTIAEPVADVRYDRVGHLPVMSSSKGRCRYCTGGYSRIECSKCGLRLCLNDKANCFFGYHTPDVVRG